jgi:hypothetical protein
MMKDTTIFVVRKRSEPESAVDSSGVLESFEEYESDFTARSAASDSELLQARPAISDS